MLNKRIVPVVVICSVMLAGGLVVYAQSNQDIYRFDREGVEPIVPGVTMYATNDSLCHDTLAQSNMLLEATLEIRDAILSLGFAQKCEVALSDAVASSVAFSPRGPTAYISVSLIDDVTVSSAQMRDIVEIVKSFIPEIREENIVIETK